MRCPNCGNACINEATSDGKTKCSNCGHWYTGDESRLAGKKVAEALGHTEAWRQNEISKPDPAAQPKEPLFGGVIGRITTEDVKRVMKEMFNEQRPFWKARCGVAQSAERPAPTAQTDTSPPAIEYVVIALEQRVTALEQRLAELREAVENGA
jgi:DNA-directed RNA polymerase subunit M/transcription elongation factor TFIIS